MRQGKLYEQHGKVKIGKKGSSALEKRAELLAPAGSLDSMKAAVKAGADAVYMGGSRFGARACAQSVEENSLAQAIDYAHIHGRRLYMTLNTLLKESEMGELYSYLGPYYVQGLDGVIVQDLGVAAFIRQNFPDLPVHGSTQMTITGPDGVKLMQQMGLHRIVPARELNLQELETICQCTDLEVEVFIHGAICYCYSGQCLFSSIIGGRSGNRGRCAQPCRLPYDVWEKGQRRNSGREQYLLSLKDLSTLEHLPELLTTGVDSLKIEGRMKGPVYTAGVVSIYRKYLDIFYQQGAGDWQIEREDLDHLSEFSTRMGYTDHYLFGQNGRNMMALKEKPVFRQVNDMLVKEIQNKYLDIEMKENLSGNLIIQTGKCATIDVEWQGIHAQAFSAQPVEPAQKQPLTRDSVKKQFSKTGNTCWQFSDLCVDVSEDAFMPVKTMNEMRRQALELLEQEIYRCYSRETTEPARPEDTMEVGFSALEDRSSFGLPGLHVTVAVPEQLEPVLQSARVQRVSMDSSGIDLARVAHYTHRCHQMDKQFYLRMPAIFRELARVEFTQHWTALMEAGLDGFVIQNLDEAGYLMEKGYKGRIITDHNFYIWNRAGWAAAKDIADRLTGSSKADDREAWIYTCPLELTDRELAASGNHEVVIYGYIPMMVSAGCIRCTTGNCDHKSSWLWLKDRKKQQFPVRNICKYCYNVIYNSCPLSLCDRTRAVEKVHPVSLRMIFAWETKQKVHEMLQLHEQAFYEGIACKMQDPFTRGHFMQSAL